MDEKFFEGVVAGVLPPPPPDPFSSGQNDMMVPCRSRMCLTPIHVCLHADILNPVFPVPVVTTLLYPGAIASGLITQKTVPRRDDLLDIYNLTNIKEASVVVDLQRLEVLSGSYFAVAGAFAGILKPGRMSMFGKLLIMWGLKKDGILGKSANLDSSRSVSVYPTMGIALICALSSIKYNMKKATRPAPARTLAKPLQSSSKSKLK